LERGPEPSPGQVGPTRVDRPRTAGGPDGGLSSVATSIDPDLPHLHQPPNGFVPLTRQTRALGTEVGAGPRPWTRARRGDLRGRGSNRNILGLSWVKCGGHRPGSWRWGRAPGLAAWTLRPARKRTGLRAGFAGRGWGVGAGGRDYRRGGDDPHRVEWSAIGAPPKDQFIEAARRLAGGRGVERAAGASGIGAAVGASARCGCRAGLGARGAGDADGAAAASRRPPTGQPGRCGARGAFLRTRLCELGRQGTPQPRLLPGLFHGDPQT